MGERIRLNGYVFTKTIEETLEVDVIDILSGEKINKNDKNKQYEKIILELFNKTSFNKKKIKYQYYLFEIIILILTLAIVMLSHKEVVTILACILMVVANTFNLSFYVLSKNVVVLLGKVNK